MADQLKESSISKQENLEYVANNKEGVSLFNGKFKVSKRVRRLIGDEKIKEIDETLKRYKGTKEEMYGENSTKVAFSEHQYFAIIPETQKERSLSYIFNNNVVIICDAEADGSYFGGEYDLLKKENFDDSDGIKWDDMEAYKDYAIYLIDDASEDSGGEIMTWEWKEIIQNRNEKIIKEIQGDNSLY